MRDRLDADVPSLQFDQTFIDVLQPIPYALSAGGADSDQEPGVETSGVETLSLAGTLTNAQPILRTPHGLV
jgi:hypothetical protein